MAPPGDTAASGPPGAAACDSLLLALPQHMLACVLDQMSSARELAALSTCSAYLRGTAAEQDVAYQHLISRELGAVADPLDLQVAPGRCWRDVYMCKRAEVLGLRICELAQEAQAARQALRVEERERRQRTLCMDLGVQHNALEVSRCRALGQQSDMWVHLRGVLRAISAACATPAAGTSGDAEGLLGALDDAWDGLRAAERHLETWRQDIQARLGAADEYALRIQAGNSPRAGRSRRQPHLVLLGRAQLIRDAAKEACFQVTQFVVSLEQQHSEVAASVRRMYLLLSAATPATVVAGAGKPGRGAATQRVPSARSRRGAVTDAVAQFRGEVAQRLSGAGAGTTDLVVALQGESREASAAVREDMRQERCAAVQSDARVRALEAVLARCEASRLQVAAQRVRVMQHAPWVRERLAGATAALARRLAQVSDEEYSD